MISMDPVGESEFTAVAAAAVGAVAAAAGGVAGSVGCTETGFEGGIGCGSTATATGGAAGRASATTGAGALGAGGRTVCCARTAGRFASARLVAPTAGLGVRCIAGVSGLFKLFVIWAGISNGEVRTGGGAIVVPSGNGSTEF
jgi:hypothetical protein